MSALRTLTGMLVVLSALFPLSAAAVVATPPRRRGGKSTRDVRVSRKPNSRSTALVELSDEPIVKTVTVPDGVVLLHYDRKNRLVSVELKPDPKGVAHKVTEGEQYLSISRAACAAGMNATWLRRKARAGDLRAVRVSREWFTTPEWLESFLANRRLPGRPRNP